MEEKKLIFLDIDGTIYSKFGFIPESAKSAIAKAKKNGHKIFASTGRSKAHIPKEIIDLGSTVLSFISFFTCK